MGCILGTHGPYVYPQASPPDPLSTTWRGGTKGEGEVHPQAPRLVGPRRTRPAMAQHARSVPRARVRVHAAADASEPRGGVLSAVPRAVPGPRNAGARAAPDGAGSLGWPRLLRPSFQSPRACARGQ